MRFAAIASAIVIMALAGASAQGPTPPVSETRTIVITLDGFRNDYLDRFQPPAITQLAREGVRARAMRPGFPSYTFPAHYTLATGLYPAQHHIIANTIDGPGWALTMNSETPPWWTWTGEPFWITAERQGVKAATMFWPASAAEINGHRPTYRRVYDAAFPYEERVAQVLRWIDMPPAERPRLITLYLEAVDHAGHTDGPASAAVRDAVARVDDTVGALMRGLKVRGLDDAVNVIVTADHGMSEVSASRRVFVSDVVSTDAFVSQGGGPYMFVNPVAGDARALLSKLRKLPHVRAYAWRKIPKHLHFREPPQPFAILLLADDGWTMAADKAKAMAQPWGAADGRTAGAHGYDVAYPSMKALFVARGPAFKHGVWLPEFDSVQVYGLVVHLLGLEPAPNAGRLGVFAGVLKIKPVPSSNH